MRAGLGSDSHFEFGKLKNRICLNKIWGEKIPIVGLRRGKWRSYVQLLTRAICLYFEYDQFEMEIMLILHKGLK